MQYVDLLVESSLYVFVAILHHFTLLFSTHYTVRAYSYGIDETLVGGMRRPSGKSQIWKLVVRKSYTVSSIYDMRKILNSFHETLLIKNEKQHIRTKACCWKWSNT